MGLQHLVDVIMDAVPRCCGQAPSHHDSTILANIYRTIPQILCQQFVKDNEFLVFLFGDACSMQIILDFSRDAKFVFQWL